MRNITETLMKPLEKFRKEHLGTIRVMYYWLSMDWFVSLFSPNCFLQRNQMDKYISFHTCLFFFSFWPFKTEKKHYEKETEKYYSSLEKLLNLSAKKKEPQLHEVFIFCWFFPSWLYSWKKMAFCWVRESFFPFFTAKPVGPCEFPVTRLQQQFSWLV